MCALQAPKCFPIFVDALLDLLFIMLVEPGNKSESKRALNSAYSADPPLVTGDIAT